MGVEGVFTKVEGILRVSIRPAHSMALPRSIDSSGAAALRIIALIPGTKDA